MMRPRPTKRLDTGEFLTILAASMLTRRWPQRNGRSRHGDTAGTRAVAEAPAGNLTTRMPPAAKLTAP